jgi:hypothetical protein
MDFDVVVLRDAATACVRPADLGAFASLTVQVV